MHVGATALLLLSLPASTTAPERVVSAAGRSAVVVNAGEPVWMAGFEADGASMPVEGTSWLRSPEGEWARSRTLRSVARAESGEGLAVRVEAPVPAPEGHALLLRFPRSIRIVVPDRRFADGTIVTGVLRRMPGTARVGNRPIADETDGFIAAVDAVSGLGVLLVADGATAGEPAPFRAGRDRGGDFLSVPFVGGRPVRTFRIEPFAGGDAELRRRVARIEPPVALPAVGRALGRSGDLRIFTAPLAERILPGTPAPDDAAADAGALAVEASPGEILALQIGLRGDVARTLSVDVAPRNGFPRTRVFEAVPRRVARASTPRGIAGEIPDELVPASRVRIAAFRTSVVVVEIEVPVSATDGERRAELRFRSARRPAVSVPILLRVRGPALSFPPSFPAFAPVWPRVVGEAVGAGRIPQLVPQLVAELGRARLGQMSPAESARPTFSKGDSLGAVDFAPLDRALRRLEATSPMPRIVLRDFRIGVAHERVDTLFGRADEAGSARWWKRIEAYAGALARHLRAAGLVDRVVLMLFDEPRPAEGPLLAELATRLRRIEPRWEPTVFGDPGEAARGAFGLLVVPEEVAPRVSPKELWILNPRGFALDSDPAEIATLGRRLADLGAAGLVQWTSTAWAEETRDRKRWDANREASWLTADAFGARPSLRLLRLRAALVELEKVRLRPSPVPR